jgi:hypothetical protein
MLIDRMTMTRAGSLATEDPVAKVVPDGPPDRPPVLGGRLNNDFLDRVLDQPVGQATQISRRST